MSSSDFKDLFNKLLEIDNKLPLLKRKQTLRNRLKILGIGYLVYKNIQNEIEESLSRRKILLGKIDGELFEYINSVRIGIERIRTSNVYLAKGNEALWLNRIEECKKELAYLRPISGLEIPNLRNG